MNKYDYEYYIKNISKILQVEEIPSVDEINKLLDQVSGYSNVDESEYIEDKDTIEISKMGSLIVGLLAMVFKECQEEEASVYAALLTTIANNIVAITKLITSGLDYQVGILLRNTYELYFILINVMIDKNKCKRYFDSVRLQNESEIWADDFKFENLEDTISKYEDKVYKNQNKDFVGEWRNKNKKFYSRLAKNSMYRCQIDSYAHCDSSEESEILRYNLWGGKVTRIDMYLSRLNELILWGSTFIKFIIDDEDNEHMRKMFHKDEEIYQEMILLDLLFKYMLCKYDVEE